MSGRSLKRRGSKRSPASLNAHSQSSLIAGIVNISITYRGGRFGAVTTRVNTRLGLPLLITRPNPARGRAATASEYFRTRFWAKRYIIWVRSVLLDGRVILL